MNPTCPIAMSIPDSTFDHEGESLRAPDFWHSGAVHRSGDMVIRDRGYWTPAVHALLRHLEKAGFPGSPRVLGNGIDARGRETLTYIEGDLRNSGQETVEAAAAVGDLLRRLHEATATFKPPESATWKEWHARYMGGETRVIGHCDAVPWNVIVREGIPVALIDWELAGPVDPLVDLAQAAWLNANLYDEIVADLECLPPLETRLLQLRAMVDAYGLVRDQRDTFLDLMIEFAVSDTAFQADDARVMRKSTEVEALWAMAWRARSAAWMFRNRRLLRQTLLD